MIRIFAVLMLIYCAQPSRGQLTLEYIQPPVTGEANLLTLPFAGGINSAQYQTIDLDADQDLDLVVFDRSSDKLNCFENTGERYVYQPAFEFLFPDNLQHWLVLADYNCDDKKDLFTYTGQGIRVFRNLAGIIGPPTWELVAEPLRTQGSSAMINLLFNPTDIPSISDLDGDGDLDILVFDFSTSTQIEFHRNLSVENTGSCDLVFERQTRTFGDIRDCDCDDWRVDSPCESAGRIQHAGGKAMLALDYNSDQVPDLVLSQEGCNNLSIATNSGSVDLTDFGPFSNNFPTMNSPLGFISFPAAFYEDVTFDGKRDILVSSNERSNSAQNINFKNSSFLFENVGDGSANVFNSSRVFLQNEMIDTGEHAFPALADINGDGLDDLVIGNAGSLIAGEYLSSLAYYQSNGTGLSWQSNDLFELSTLGYTYIKPQFIDLNEDARPDLVFSAQNGSNQMGLYYIINEGNSAMAFDVADITSIALTFTVLDDFHLTDIDNDGLPDLLLGLSGGRLDYYRNTGSTPNPAFSLETQEFLGLGFDSERGNLSLASGDFDGDDLTDLITTDRSGQTRYYADFRSSTAVAQLLPIRSSEGTDLGPTRFGRVTKPYAGQLAGRNVLTIGSIQGGVRLLATSGVSGDNRLTLSAYPVPSANDGLITFYTNQSGTLLEIYTISGQVVETSSLSSFSTTPLDLRHLEDGIYLARVTKGSNSCTVKIVLSSDE